MADNSLNNVFAYETVLAAAKAARLAGKPFFNIKVRSDNKTFGKGSKFYTLESLIGTAKTPVKYQPIKCGFRSDTEPLVNVLNYESSYNKFERAVGVSLKDAPKLYEFLAVMSEEFALAIENAKVSKEPGQKLNFGKKNVNPILVTHYAANHAKEDLQGKIIESPKGIFKFNWGTGANKNSVFYAKRNRVFEYAGEGIAPIPAVDHETGLPFGENNYTNFFKGGEKIHEMIWEMETVADTTQISVPLTIFRMVVDFKAREGFSNNNGDFAIVNPALAATPAVDKLTESINNLDAGDSDEEDDVGDFDMTPTPVKLETPTPAKK